MVSHSIKCTIYYVKNTQDKGATCKVHDAIYNNYGTLGNIYWQNNEATQYPKEDVVEGNTSKN